jgi:hypothetical protein
MKKKKEMWPSMTWQYTLTTNIGEEKKKGLWMLEVLQKEY